MSEKDDQKIRDHYESMTNEQISARIISGEVTERAMMIGKQILSERGLNGDDLNRITAVAEKAHKEEKSNRYWLWLLVFLPLWLTYKYFRTHH